MTSWFIAYKYSKYYLIFKIFIHVLGSTCYEQVSVSTKVVLNMFYLPLLLIVVLGYLPVSPS